MIDFTFVIKVILFSDQREDSLQYRIKFASNNLYYFWCRGNIQRRTGSQRLPFLTKVSLNSTSLPFDFHVHFTRIYRIFFSVIKSVSLSFCLLFFFSLLFHLTSATKISIPVCRQIFHSQGLLLPVVVGHRPYKYNTDAYYRRL